MAIPIVHDGTVGGIGGDPAEHCCFCFGRTRYWNKRRDVAVCPDCAKVRKAAEIPPKAVWCDRVGERFPHLCRPTWRC
jgi:hypothetical protein